MIRQIVSACAALAVLTICGHAVAKDGSDYVFVYCEDWIQTENADGSQREDYYYSPALKILTSTWEDHGFSQNEFEIHLTDYNSVIYDKHLKRGQTVERNYCQVLSVADVAGDVEQTKIRNLNAQIINDGRPIDQKDTITSHKTTWIPDIFMDYNGKEFSISYTH